MPPSEAYRISIVSPRSRASSSWRRISAVAIPRRRCVGRTPTPVTKPTSIAPPGIVIGIVNAAVVPAITSPSNAAKKRSSSVSVRSNSTSSSVGTPPNAYSVVAIASAKRSSVTVRMSNVIRASLRGRQGLEHVVQDGVAGRALGPCHDERLGLQHRRPELHRDVLELGLGRVLAQRRELALVHR